MTLGDVNRSVDEIENVFVKYVDANMHDRWAARLANAAAVPDTISPAFPRILAELSPLDANILQYGKNK